MGKPKQNLVYKDKTLLQRTVETALASVCYPVIVVLGANDDLVRPTIESCDVTIVQNSDWKEGLASSIRSGIKELQLTSPAIKSVILMLCDQPFVDTYLLNLLVLAKSKAGIVVSLYNEAIGPPVLFDAAYFNELLLLKGDEGARKVIQKHPSKVTEIPFPQGGVDIDTVEDYDRVISP